MALQAARGRGCYAGRCCCPSLATTTIFLHRDDKRRVDSTVFPDAQQQQVSDIIHGGGANSVKVNSTQPISVEEAEVPAINEKSCSVHSMMVQQK